MPEENKWHGLSEIDYIYHNDWSDSELIYKNWHFNGVYLEDDLWQEYKEISGIKNSEDMEEGFSKFLQNNASYVYSLLDNMKNASRVAESLESFSDMLEDEFNLKLSKDYKEALYSAFKMSMSSELDSGLYKGYADRIYIGNENYYFSDFASLMREAFFNYEDSILDEIVYKILDNPPNNMSKDKWSHVIADLTGADQSRLPQTDYDYNDAIYWHLRSNAESHINDLAEYAGNCNNDFRKALCDLAKGNVFRHFFNNVIQNKDHCSNQDFTETAEVVKPVKEVYKLLFRQDYSAKTGNFSR